MASAINATVPQPLPAPQQGARVWPLIVLAALFGSSIALAGESAFILAMTLVVCVFIMVDFRVGAVLLIVMMPISNSSVFPHEMMGIKGLNPFNVLLMGTLSAWFLQRQPQEKVGAFVPRPLLWLYVVPIVAAGVLGVRHVDEIAQHFFAGDLLQFDSPFGYVRDNVVKPLFLVLFALLVAAAAARSKDPERFLWPMLVSVCVMTSLALVFFRLSGYSLDLLATVRSFFRPLGIHANDLGRLFAVAYALLLFTFAKTERPALKTGLLIAIGAVVVALMLTFSRGAFAGFMLVNVLFLLSRRNPLGLVLFLLLMAVSLALLPGAVYERISVGMDGDLNQLSAGRTEEIWLPLMPEFFKSPLWGSGLMSITWSDAMRNGSMLPVTHAHNAYLQTYLDMGIIGLGLLCAYFLHVYRGFRRLSRDPGLSPARQGLFEGAAAGLVCLLFAGIAGGGLVPGPEQAFLWLAIGLMYGEFARKQQKA